MVGSIQGYVTLKGVGAMPRESIGFTETPPRVSQFKHFVRVFFSRKVVIFGLVIIVIFLVTAAFAPSLAPYDPYKQNLDEDLLQPNRQHLLGTDALGRDTLSRVIYGTRTSLMVGVIAIGIAASLGMSLGLIAGFFGGITNTIIMRFIDSLMAFPMLILALAISAMLGGGLKNIMIAVGISMMSTYARLMCGQVLTIKENDYVMAERSMGASNSRIMAAHILPNCFPPLIIMITMQMGGAIMAEASLSFLGIGISPPGAAWGAMVNDGYKYLLSHPMLAFAPGIAIMLVVFAFNMVGDGLRDALDPRLRGTL
jgi:ABC-type dipeptide/oligopeptide/nickel transport system permease subunit